MTGAAEFREHHVEADGFRIRYLEAGDGPPLVHLHGAGGLRLNPAHALLAQHYRVIAFEMPGFGVSAENTKSQSMAELARTMGKAAARLGLDRFNLMGTSFGGKAALWLAAQLPERVTALVLEAPAAMDPAIAAQTGRLVGRLRGPDRDAALEALLPGLATPTLVLFGTLDKVIPSQMGRHYKTLLPNCNLVLVYDAGHAIGTDRPEAFCEVVTDFLERHEAFIISQTETLINP